MISCIVVDDEQPARELLAMHLLSLQSFQLVASFNNGIDAFSFLQKNQVDLVFLDIQMPMYSGLELIRSLKSAPQIILTTAHREHAVEAFELDVLDYIVKPITRERFMKAISKFSCRENSHADEKAFSTGFDKAYFFLKTGKQQIKMYLRDIIFIEGFKDFTKIHTAQKTIVASERISYMEEKLPENRFARIHKSYIVSLEKITVVHTEQITVGNITLPIGRVFKKGFLRKLKYVQKNDRDQKAS